METWTKPQLVALAVALLLGFISLGLRMSGYINRRIGLSLVAVSGLGLLAVLIWAFWSSIAPVAVPGVLVLGAIVLGAALITAGIYLLRRIRRARAGKRHDDSLSGQPQCKAVLRALEDYGKWSKGDYFGVPFAEAERHLRSSRVQLVDSAEKAAQCLLEEIAKVQGAIARFPESGGGGLGYYPARAVRAEWIRLLNILRQAIGVAQDLDPDEKYAYGDYRELESCFRRLHTETTRGGGRLWYYQECAAELEAWAAHYRRALRLHAPSR